MFGVEPIVIFLGVVILIGLFVAGSLIANMYQKCSPNQAMIISGMWAGQGERNFKSSSVVALLYCPWCNREIR